MSSLNDGLIKQLIGDHALRGFIEPISLALELIGVVIIIYGAVVTLIFLIKAEAKSVKQSGRNQYRVKQQFTTRLLTGLEFFIAGDVLKTIMNPTLESLAVVGAIVAIRAALTYLLNRELKDERERENTGGDDNKNVEAKGKEAADDNKERRKQSFHAEGA